MKEFFKQGTWSRTKACVFAAVWALISIWIMSFALSFGNGWWTFPVIGSFAILAGGGAIFFLTRAD